MSDPPTPEPEIDTTNDHLVGSRGDHVVVVLPPTSPITRQAALRLAAWLVVIADHSPGHADFSAVLAAVEST